MAEPVRGRRLTDQEGQQLQKIVRRGSTSSVRYRRAMMLLASAGGNRVPVIARFVQADEDTVRDVIHRFNEIGLACLDPRWAGGRPRLLSPDDEDFVVQTATTRPTKLGQPFTRWSVRKLAAYLRKVRSRWSASAVRTCECTANTLAALRSIRAARPDGAPVYVILDNLSAHKGKKILRWAKNNNVHLCFTPTSASWANPIEAHFGPLRQFTLANSNHPNHTVQTGELHRYLRWRNANARHPDVLAAQRRERARVRSEEGIRWGRTAAGRA
ncbi:helix-turn-helix domain-containing protein [Streptomyces chartreusis]|uniref:helix-turn-helix domain-containing protein n=1 Tax=Streptomyces chartreusis TaxID=1969 RepID=UPI003824E510